MRTVKAMDASEFSLKVPAGLPRRSRESALEAGGGDGQPFRPWAALPCCVPQERCSLSGLASALSIHYAVAY